MKKAKLISLAIFPLLLVGCGGNDTSTQSSVDSSEKTSERELRDKHYVPTSEVTIAGVMEDPNAAPYYEGITNFDTLAGEELETALRELLQSTVRLIQYSGGGRNVWDAVKEADLYVDEDGVKWIRGIYSRNLIPFANQQGNINETKANTYNREHVVPRSFLQNATHKENDPYGSPNASTDIANIFAEDYLVNSKRGTMKFGEVPYPTYISFIEDSVGRQTDVNVNTSAGVIEPTDLSKGEIARVNLYMLLMYPQYIRIGQTGDLSTFLKWNIEFQPTKERDYLRNEVIFEYQRNRNPFIDDYNLACRIWGEYDDTTKQVCRV